MSNVVNLEDYKTILESGQAIDQIYENARADLDRLLCANVREFDGQMLRKIRDRILQFRYVIVTTSPGAQERIEARVGTLNRVLSAEETLELFAPELAQVSVRFV